MSTNPIPSARSLPMVVVAAAGALALALVAVVGLSGGAVAEERTPPHGPMEGREHRHAEHDPAEHEARMAEHAAELGVDVAVLADAMAGVRELTGPDRRAAMADVMGELGIDPAAMMAERRADHDHGQRGMGRQGMAGPHGRG